MTDLVARVRRRMAADAVDLDTVVRAESEQIVDDAALARLRGSVEAELVGAGLWGSKTSAQSSEPGSA